MKKFFIVSCMIVGVIGLLSLFGGAQTQTPPQKSTIAPESPPSDAIVALQTLTERLEALEQKSTLTNDELLSLRLDFEKLKADLTAIDAEIAKFNKIKINDKLEQINNRLVLLEKKSVRLSVGLTFGAPLLTVRLKVYFPRVDADIYFIASSLIPNTAEESMKTCVTYGAANAIRNYSTLRAGIIRCHHEPYKFEIVGEFLLPPPYPEINVGAEFTTKGVIPKISFMYSF